MQPKKAFLSSAGLLVCFLTAIVGAQSPLLAASCEKPATEIFRSASRYVVKIASIGIDPFDLRRRVRVQFGSGIVLDETGLIVTNHHVVLGSKYIWVSLDGRKLHKAQLIAADPVLDLAVIRPDMNIAIGAVPEIANSDELEIGQTVFAVGNPFNVGKSMSKGIISALNRVVPMRSTSWLTPHIQTDAALNPGNSGGPLLDGCGRVIGINVLVVPRGQNIGFALPIKLALEAVRQLVADKRVTRVWHGIFGQMVDLSLSEILNVPIVQGFLIETIEPGSPAEKAGLRGGVLPIRYGQKQILLGGDIITRVNDADLNSMNVVLKVLKSLRVGDKIKVTYFRDGLLRTVDVTLPARPTLPGDLRVLRSISRRRSVEDISKSQ